MSYRLKLRACALLCLVGAFACPARAQETVPRGAGIAGGALIGAEVVVLAEAALDVEPAMAYVLGGLAGALGGAYVGFRVESAAEPSASVWMLAAGMGFVIPTVIWVGNAREPRPRATVPAASPPLSPKDGAHDARRDRFAAGVALTLPLVRGVW